jgi:hypothetical protein
MSKITFLTRFLLEKGIYTDLSSGTHEGGLFKLFTLSHKKALDGHQNVAFKALGEDGFKIETP